MNLSKTPKASRSFSGQAKPAIIPANGGQILNAFGDQLQVKLTPEQTGGKLTLFLDTTPPKGGPPLHSHANEDEIFIVQSGSIWYFIENQWCELGPGGVAFAPRGSVHTFHNAGDQPARHWVIATPSGFETFFARCAEEFARSAAPDMARINEISAEHGITYAPNGSRSGNPPAD